MDSKQRDRKHIGHTSQIRAEKEGERFSSFCRRVVGKEGKKRKSSEDRERNSCQRLNNIDK